MRTSPFEEAVNSALPHLTDLLNQQNKLNPTFETQEVETSNFFGHVKTTPQTLTHQNPIPENLHSKETDLDEVRTKFRTIFGDTPLRWIAPVSVIKEMCVKSKKMYFWRYMSIDGTIYTVDGNKFWWDWLRYAILGCAFCILVCGWIATDRGEVGEFLLWTSILLIPVQFGIFCLWFFTTAKPILSKRYFDLSSRQSEKDLHVYERQIQFISAPDDFIDTIKYIIAKERRPVYLCHRKSFSYKTIRLVPELPCPVVGIIVTANSGTQYLCAMNMYGKIPEEEKLDTLYTNIYVNQFMTENFGKNWKN